MRDRREVRQKQLNQIGALEDLGLLGKEEDQWDRIVESTFGIPYDHGSWAEYSIECIRELKALRSRHHNRAMIIARKMQEIVDKEQALADIEKSKRRNEKKRMRKARKEACSVNDRESEGVENSSYSTAPTSQ